MEIILNSLDQGIVFIDEKDSVSLINEEGKNRQKTLQLQMIRQSHRAKYTFEDTIGESPAVPRATEIAKPMAGNNVSILLDGESGTGKTLCAGNQQRFPPAEQQLSP